MKRIVKFAMVILMFFMVAEPVRSIGLGDITIFSAVNEPLYAELNILDASIENTKEISFGLLAADNLDQFPTFNADINLTLKISDKDVPVIVVSTVNPILDEAVEITVFASSDDEKIYSSYLLQLIPLGVKNTGAVRVFSAISTGSHKNSIDQKSKDITLNAPYGPIEQSENLIIIANRLVITSPLSIYQKLYALLKNNDHAFIQGNMNLLRAGVFIDIPSIKEFELTSRILAIETYTQQVAEWQEYRLKNFPKTLDKNSAQPVDPAIAFMNATVIELRKEIEKLRTMLDESLVEKTRAYELRNEEKEFRKSLEKDIERLEQSKRSLLETISSIMKSVDNNTKYPNVSDETQSEEQNQDKLVYSDEKTNTDIKRSDAGKANSESQQLQELREEMLSVESEIESQRVRNQSMKQEIEELKKEKERTDELLEEQSTALVLAQREAAVYSAALESFDTKSDGGTLPPQTEDQTSESDSQKDGNQNRNENDLAGDQRLTPDQENTGSTQASSQEQNNNNVVAEFSSENIYFWLVVGLIIGGFITATIILIFNRQKSSNNLKTINDVDGNFDDLGLETKMDLAKAYIEMDETDKARELLLEVKIKGNIAQRTKAEETLNRIK